MTQEEINQIVSTIGADLQLCQKEILTADEAARYLGMTKNALYKLTHNRIIPFSKPNGKMCYFRRTDLEDWMMSNPVATTSELNAKALGHCMRTRR